MSLALLWYAVDARKWFKGPRINVEHLIHMQTIEGDASGSDRAEQVNFEKKE
jgi:hypothetical protein